MLGTNPLFAAVGGSGEGSGKGKKIPEVHSPCPEGLAGLRWSGQGLVCGRGTGGIVPLPPAHAACRLGNSSLNVWPRDAIGQQGPLDKTQAHPWLSPWGSGGGPGHTELTRPASCLRLGSPGPAFCGRRSKRFLLGRPPLPGALGHWIRSPVPTYSRVLGKSSPRLPRGQGPSQRVPLLVLCESPSPSCSASGPWGSPSPHQRLK